MDKRISMHGCNCEKRLDGVKEVIDQLINTGQKPWKGRHKIMMAGLYFLSSQLRSPIKDKIVKVEGRR